MNNEDIDDYDEELIRLLAKVKPIDIQFKIIECIDSNHYSIGFKLPNELLFHTYKIDYDKEDVLSICKKKYIPYIRQRELRYLQKWYNEWYNKQEYSRENKISLYIMKKVIKKKYSCKNIGFLIDISNYGGIII